MKKISLKKGKEEAVRRFHPWIFSGAVAKADETLKDGDLVEVVDYKQQFLAIGYYNDGSILVRLLSFEKRPIDAAFWTEKMANAVAFRQKLGLIDNPDTSCYRLIHAEGDGLPGLIIDVYGAVAVVQCHAIGMHLQLPAIAQALQTALGARLTAVYDKSAETLPAAYVSAAAVANGYIVGQAETPQYVRENGHQFAVDWVTGQKTGFFLDQRDNRALVERYAQGKRVLNAFCYSGGFSVYALAAGATAVHSVDISAKAIELTHTNVALNGQTDTHSAEAVDVMPFLKANTAVYDLMVVDPPAFAKSINKRHNAVQAYKRLNTMALQQIAKGGILFTFSCSQVVDSALFYNTIVAAAIEAGRRVRVMHHLTQPADHPVSMFHPEGAYLKGLVLYVE